MLLGSNNALQAVTKLKVAWSGDGYADVDKKGAYTVWRPEHFAAEWALLVAELRRIRARHVIVGTVPSVTIAPIARGRAGKSRGSGRATSLTTRARGSATRTSIPNPTPTSPRRKRARSTRRSTPTTRRSSSPSPRQDKTGWTGISSTSAASSIASHQSGTCPTLPPDRTGGLPIRCRPSWRASTRSRTPGSSPPDRPGAPTAASSRSTASTRPQSPTG